MSPPDTAAIDLPRSASDRRVVERDVRRLPPGTRTALFSSGPWARRRSHRFATRCGISIDREYLVFPSVGSPRYLVEESPETIRYFSSSALTVPPGVTVLGGLANVLLQVARRLPPGAMALVTPGRISMGYRR